MEFNLSIRIIEVVDYNPIWKDAFESEKLLLSGVLGCKAIKIEHIGSTSVLGLAAKPIIDILVEVTKLADLDALNEEFEAIGYLVEGENGIPGRRFFQKGGNQRSHHVHAFQTYDDSLIRHRAFKEYLIAHPIIALEYGKIKKESLLKSNNNINVYMSLKNNFIQKHEKLALEWFSN